MELMRLTRMTQISYPSNYIAPWKAIGVVDSLETVRTPAAAEDLKRTERHDAINLTAKPSSFLF
jgi:hypothetical protein